MDEKGATWFRRREVMNGGKIADELRKSGLLKLKVYQPAQQFLRPKTPRIIGCKRWLLASVTFQNSPNWALNPVLWGDDVSLLNVQVRKLAAAQNRDAWSSWRARKSSARAEFVAAKISSNFIRR